MEPVLTLEDERVMARLGITREKFIASRKVEQERAATRAAARAKPAPMSPKPKGSATMSAPCPNCSHTSPHACSASSCSCVDPMATPEPSEADLEVAARLGVNAGAFAKTRQAEARRSRS